MQQYIAYYCQKEGKKFIIGDTGLVTAGKMLSMAAKKFGLKCKIMGAKDIKETTTKLLKLKRNGAEKASSCLY